MLATAYDPILVAFASLIAALALGPNGTTLDNIIFFRTPSKNIACAYLKSGSEPAVLRCDILSGLRPKPPRPRSCRFDWAVGFNMNGVGRARMTCASDSVYAEKGQVIAYGGRWHVGRFTCLSRRIGLRCVNAGRHGFFLSRARSYRF